MLTPTKQRECRTCGSTFSPWSSFIDGGRMNLIIGFVWCFCTFLLGACLASVAVGGYLKDCETLGKTRLAGVAIECKVIR